MILPGATIGIIGGGQLGRMSAMAARSMGYRVVVLEPNDPCACSDLVHQHLVADYNDSSALDELFSLCDVITFEFENVSCPPLMERLARKPIRPSPQILHITQNRQREKEFLSKAGFPLASFLLLDPKDAESPTTDKITPLLPGIVKTCSFGYDGKGQCGVSTLDDLHQARKDCPDEWLVLEKKISFQAEYSVLVARAPSGECVCYPACQNIHRNHILDVTLSPGDLSPAKEEEVRALAKSVASAFDLEGLIAIEFFLDEDENWLINEIAPRPHNSGHHTMNGSHTSQFGNFIRAVCNLPLGDTSSINYSFMQNLLGEDLRDGGVQRVVETLADPSLHLHLYEKGEARTGRKMGHINGTASNPAERGDKLKTLRKHLRMTGW